MRPPFSSFLLPFNSTYITLLHRPFWFATFLTLISRVITTVTVLIVGDCLQGILRNASREVDRPPVPSRFHPVARGQADLLS